MSFTPQPGAHSLKIGWYGLGSMGFVMARNLARYRSALPNVPPLLVFNRSASKSQDLQKLVGADNIQIASSSEQLVHECDVVFTILANDAVVQSAYAQFVAALKQSPPKQRKILVEMSTVYPTVADELSTVVSQVPLVNLVTCPVFGAPSAAEIGALICVLAGEQSAKDIIASILVPAVGKKAMNLGTDIKKAPTFKLIGNSLVLGTLEILAEAFTLADKAGIGSDIAFELVKEMFPAPSFLRYGHKMSTDHFDAREGFSIDGGMKDATHISQLAAELNCPMPTVDAGRRNLVTARAQEALQRARGEPLSELLDWCSLIAGQRVAAGLEPFDSSKHPKVAKG